MAASSANDHPRPPRPPVGSAEWWDARAARREPLSAPRIVAAALHLIETEGSDALTMRRLSEALGTAPASLYRHIESRDALMLLISEAILAEVTFEDTPDATWQERTATYAYAVRRALDRHPSRAEFCLGPEAPSPEALSVFRRGIDVYLEAGFPPDLAVAAGQAVVFLISSFVIVQAEWPSTLIVTPGSLVPPDQDRFPGARRIDGLDAEEPTDELFDFMLHATIDGIERRLAHARSGPTPQG